MLLWSQLWTRLLKENDLSTIMFRIGIIHRVSREARFCMLLQNGYDQ